MSLNAIWSDYTEKGCNKFVDILQQIVTTSRYLDAFAWLATDC